MTEFLQILSIDIERASAEGECGTLHFAAASAVAGAVLWTTRWGRGRKVSVEFVPAEGADQDFVRTHHAALVDAVVGAARAGAGRKALFS